MPTVPTPAGGYTLRPILWNKRAFLAVAHLTITVAFPAPARAGIPTVTATRLKADFHLDGQLTESAWDSAGVTPDLAQQRPQPGEPTPYRTEIRFLADDDTLYIGVICHDPSPDRIAVHTIQRDGNMRGDDSLAIVLDTFGDRRTGYFFRINSRSVRKFRRSRIRAILPHGSSMR